MPAKSLHRYATVSAVIGMEVLLSLAASAQRTTLQPDVAAGLTGFVSKKANSEIRAKYGNLPLNFESNAGQFRQPVKYMMHGTGYTLSLTRSEAVFALQNSPGTPKSKDQIPKSKMPSLLRIQFVGGHPRTVSGEAMLPGTSNYFIGRDPKHWRTNVSNYRRIRYKSVYPGTDLLYYGNQRQLEYDFIVAPKADPSRISMKFLGAEGIKRDPTGGLVFQVGRGKACWRKPVAYQVIDGKRKTIQARFAVRGANTVGFAISAYDVRRELIIDPVFAYSSYLGGSFEDDAAGVAIDPDGAAYLCGKTTYSDDLTGATGSPGGTIGFVSKVAPDGTSVQYSTYITDGIPQSIAVDSTGHAYIAGYTTSPNLAVVNGAQSVYAGGTDAFVMKLHALGNSVLYSTYLGGSMGDAASGVALAPDGTVRVTGITKSTDFPTMNAWQNANAGREDAFVAHIDPSVSGRPGLKYSTYFGGTDDEEPIAIAVNSIGDDFITGQTFSTNLPLAAAYQSSPHSVFLTAFSSNGGALLYSTYFGGENLDVVSAMAVDAHRRAYIVGHTYSRNFPVRNAIQSSFQGTFAANSADAFVAEIDCSTAGDASLVYSTYLGGDKYNPTAVAIDVWGNTYVSGSAASVGFSILGPRVFVSKIANGDGRLLFDQLTGGNGYNAVGGMAVDPLGYVFVAGTTTALDFPTTPGAFQPTKKGTSAIDNSARDAFIFRMSTFTKLDLNGDGSPDFLFQNAVDGRIVYWTMHADQAAQIGFLGPSNPGVNWKVVASADLNGDGQTDLLLQDANTGNVAYWLMNGTMQIGVGFISPKNPGADWQVAGMADFNRDGYADILFHNSKTGELYIWYMQGVNRIAGAPLFGGFSFNERVAAIGDMNNDGQADIIFQDGQTGIIRIQLLHGDNAVLGGGFINPSHPGPGWNVVGLADLTGDGRPEILFQNANDGQLAYWVMDGLNVIRVGRPYPFDPGGVVWKLVGQ